MAMLQKAVRAARRVVPRGWSPVVRGLARALPGLRRYRADMLDGDSLVLDLREQMCHGYFFSGELPHERGVATLLRKTLRPRSVFVDVGANLGYHTVRASRLVGPEGAVYAFEPMPAALELLRANTRGLANTTVFPVALADREGEVDFFVRPAGDTSSLLPSDEATRVRVPLTTLDAALASVPRVHVVKIDVEGAEMGVLRGASAIIERDQPVICFECLPDAGEDAYDAYERFFRERGYRLRWLKPTLDEAELFDTVRSSDLVAIPESAASTLLA